MNAARSRLAHHHHLPDLPGQVLVRPRDVDRDAPVVVRVLVSVAGAGGAVRRVGRGWVSPLAVGGIVHPARGRGQRVGDAVADDLPSGGPGRVGEPWLGLDGGHDSAVRDRRIGQPVGGLGHLAREVGRRLAEVVVEGRRVRRVDQHHGPEHARDQDHDGDEDLGDRDARLIAQRARPVAPARFAGVGHRWRCRPWRGHRPVIGSGERKTEA